MYFLKAAELGAAPASFANPLLWLTIGGTVAGAASLWRRNFAATLLLWMPLPFYAYSVAYGSVPIFIPVWWPFSWYNVRYGMEMLPAFALFGATFVAWILGVAKGRAPGAGPWIVAAAVLAILGNSLAVLRATPLALQEAIANSRTRKLDEQTMALTLQPLSRRTTGAILMETSEHPGALQRAGIPLKRTINEGDYYQWGAALSDPARAASLIVAVDGGPVANAVKQHPEGLELLTVIQLTDGRNLRIYASREAAVR